MRNNTRIVAERVHVSSIAASHGVLGASENLGCGLVLRRYGVMAMVPTLAASIKRSNRYDASAHTRPSSLFFSCLAYCFTRFTRFTRLVLQQTTR